MQGDDDQKQSNTPPVVVCFHGSGEDPLPSWESFVQLTRTEYTVVLLNRGTQHRDLTDANTELLNHLTKEHLKLPYILIAHSYGGAFAKMFLYQNPEMVAGMVLIETGQEGGLPEEVERWLLDRSALGSRPLSVIRGNSLIKSWESLLMVEKAAETDAARVEVEGRREMLETCDVEDERLKKAQLRMSKVTRYVHLPDCGHNVVRDRPDVVLEELRWVVQHMRPVTAKASLWAKVKGLWMTGRSIIE